MPVWLKEKLYLKDTLKKELARLGGIRKNQVQNLLFAEYRVLAETGKLLWAFEISLPEQATTIQ